MWIRSLYKVDLNNYTGISSHYESPELKTEFLDLKSLEDLKRFISTFGLLTFWSLSSAVSQFLSLATQLLIY